MKVKELQEILQKCNPDASVCIDIDQAGFNINKAFVRSEDEIFLISKLVDDYIADMEYEINNLQRRLDELDPMTYEEMVDFYDSVGTDEDVE